MNRRTCDLAADLRGQFDALHREFARVRNLAIAAAGLTVAQAAIFGALALGAGG